MTIPSQSIDRSKSHRPEESERREYPVREYIGAMAVELAQMARWDGDEDLGLLLDAAAARAAGTAPALRVDLDPVARRHIA
ncbi:hypothetical protein [Brevundimonas bacteroides]|uniref:hypothetical protein n=1 Tax=Brevundimonas bacteroides TaxID=74311 RepID=UPI000B1C47D1|nr:hypothetical protein [Brevundimonas bacteroides]